MNEIKNYGYNDGPVWIDTKSSFRKGFRQPRTSKHKNQKKR